MLLLSSRCLSTFSHNWLLKRREGWGNLPLFFRAPEKPRNSTNQWQRRGSVLRQAIL